MFGIGGTVYRRGVTRIFLSRARDKVQTTPTPKISFLLGFRPLYLGNIKRSKNKKKTEKKKTKKTAKSESPDSLHLTALVGTDIGRSPLVATNKIFLVREDSAPLEI